ncbi:hypothetical protein [Costertonia aggregata]|uniref:TerB family tellurite resistance protein n=1 Tax=Costertonia aggregata TaxID=343403 RepID=A0A7H9AST6_9FLAO|nr:hypothetical protein [Costertonia aggregata]QLG46533.1 hypothetical protein HYG79_14650 [Costertonia aggregata]
MDKIGLFSKELSNLYAIAKQVNHYFNGSDISFLSDKDQAILVDYVKFSCANEEQVSRSLRNLEINPGNTTDSIVQEMTENLQEISNQSGLNEEIKAMGYMMSLNRLISYHAANIHILDYYSHEL